MVDWEKNCCRMLTFFWNREIDVRWTMPTPGFTNISYLDETGLSEWGGRSILTSIV